MIFYEVVTMHFRAQMKSCVLSATALTRCLCFNSGIVVKVQPFADYVESPSKAKVVLADSGIRTFQPRIPKFDTFGRHRSDGEATFWRLTRSICGDRKQ